jgi:hypothetical protein
MFSFIERTLSLCQSLTEDYDESHGLNHHIRVFCNAIQIFCPVAVATGIIKNREKLTRYVKYITYVTLLHDVIDHKYPNNMEEKKQRLRQFLIDELKEEHEYIYWIIDNMSYSKEVKHGYPLHHDSEIQEIRDICSDADKIDALGKDGLARCILTTIHMKGDKISDEDIVSNVIQHSHDKLLRLKDSYIKIGKELAEKGHSEILHYINNPNELLQLVRDCR